MHKPVLLDEVLKYLDPQSGQMIIDATIDGGGQAAAILEKIKPEGKLLGIEWDKDLYRQLRASWEEQEYLNEAVLVNDNYANLEKIADREGFGKVDAVLFDLGLSSWHLEESGRGFSFRRDELLDMRFNTDQVVSALELVNTKAEKDLERIIEDYGEERFAWPIARAIVVERKKGAIKTSGHLAKVIEGAVPWWYRQRKINPATKTFQALRMAVNGELENIFRGLQSALKTLKPGGRLAIITFHGLEDKVVKEVVKEARRRGELKPLTKGVVRPSREELSNNPRARSAKLRVYQKN